MIKNLKLKIIKKITGGATGFFTVSIEKILKIVLIRIKR